MKKVDCDGRVTLIAEGLNETGTPFFGVQDRHYLMGAWTDVAGAAYIAVYGAQKVKKLNSQGKVEEILQSPTEWSPTGGYFDADQNLWVLEYSKHNQARIRRIDSQGKSTTFQNK